MDAVSDPVIGWLSDRWRPAFGRRRGFFLMALPVAAISCVMLFWPPEKPGALYLAFWGAALSMGFTATQLSYTAWGAELAGNYRERSRIAGFREAFTLVGTLIAIALPFAIGIEGGGLHGLAVLGLVGRRRPARVRRARRRQGAGAAANTRSPRCGSSRACATWRATGRSSG